MGTSGRYNSCRSKNEKIIDKRYYHTIKEVKNGEGPHPLKTSSGWLHLAHGVRGCASGLRYVLYMYMTSLEDPTKVIAAPAGYFMAPVGKNVLEMYRMYFSVMVGLLMKMELFLFIMHLRIRVCMWQHLLLIVWWIIA